MFKISFEWCCETTLFCVHCWPQNVCQASRWLCSSPLCIVYLPSRYVGRRFLKTTQGKTTPRKTECFFFSGVNLPLAACLTHLRMITWWKSHLSVVTRRDTQKRNSCTQTQKYIRIYNKHTYTWGVVKFGIFVQPACLCNTKVGREKGGGIGNNDSILTALRPQLRNRHSIKTQSGNTDRKQIELTEAGEHCTFY